MSAVGDARKRLAQAAAVTNATTLAEALRDCGVEVGYVGGDSFRRVVAVRLLASDWLADLLAEVRGEERERVAQAIEAVRSPSLSLTEIGHLDHAARIARTEAGS